MILVHERRGARHRALRFGLGLAVAATGNAASAAPKFPDSEPTVAKAPAAALRLELGAGEEVVDLAVALTAPRAAFVVQRSGKGDEVRTWDLSSKVASSVWTAPKGVAAREIIWHPDGSGVFLVLQEGTKRRVARLSTGGKAELTTVSPLPAGAHHLVVGPRPFVTKVGNDWGDSEVSYRLFYAENAGKGGAPRVTTITEKGSKPYQVIGADEQKVPDDQDISPSTITAPAATPRSFHPGGHVLLWTDAKGCFQKARYANSFWADSEPFGKKAVCGGDLRWTPNGLAWLHWQARAAGVKLIQDRGARESVLAGESTFLMTPLMTPDGGGLVGVVKGALVYEPVRQPLADVVNAWMFVEEPSDAQSLEKNGGAFRTLGGSQLYSLYDSELYHCGGFDQTSPTRPYLVTTDVFWEMWAAAYEGAFILLERQAALPAFKTFVEGAAKHFANGEKAGRLGDVTAALARVLAGKPAKDKEAALILEGKGSQHSAVLGEDFAYGDLAPRGHYDDAEGPMARYFRAFRYLTSIELTPAERSALGSLPPEVRKAAAEWISTYAKLIAPSRAPLVWDDAGKKTGTAPWARYPVAEARTFPLSWGFDNEAMHGTVFHSTWPEPKQIKGPKGPRLMPSGLDVAVALGSETARQALRADGELKDYPPLEGALDALADHWKKAGRGKGSTLYDKWLEALAVQWSEASPSPGGKTSEPLWRTKRLQSGLASWATLRHATVLVNERVVAECGEAGFEELVMRTPRGAVEADPETFEAIATLFDALKAHVETAVPKLAGSEPTEPYGEAKPRNVKEGLLARLTEAARKTRHFADMAKRQAAGQALTDEEYDEIIWVGRVVEHAFLVFKSLGSKDLALSNPEDMAKIADVALGGAGGPYRHVAVGRSLEFDQIVPFYGRRQLVKGPVYSYYEVDDAEPLDDEKWRERVDKAERPGWVTPYLVKAKLSCPVNAP